MSAAAPIRPTPATLMSWVQTVCEWASRLGIYLLPVFYVAFFAVLFLLWCEPPATFWLVAAGGALGWSMALWALVFCLASLRRAAAPDHAVAFAGQAGAPATRFAQKPTRACRESCPTPGGDPGRFSAACFHTRCTDVPAIARKPANPRSVPLRCNH